MPLGILRTVVPAAPDAWITRAARLRDDDASATSRRAAIRFAREGFAVFELPRRADRGARARLSRAGRRTRRSSCPAARPPRVGERFVQTDLAAHAALHGRPRSAPPRGARRRWPASRRRARRSTAATSRATIVALPRARTAACSRARTSPASAAARAAGARALARLRGLHLRAVVPGPDAGRRRCA